MTPVSGTSVVLPFLLETVPPMEGSPAVETHVNEGDDMRNGYGALAVSLALSAVMAACDEDMMTPDEETTFEVTIENISPAYEFIRSGVFDTPLGAGAAGPAMPGAAFEFSFSAPPGASLSFATMMAQSNDFFYAPDGEGIALWDANGDQVTGDVTAQVALWDAGTEADEEPGAGANQAPRQPASNTGDDDPVDMVRVAADDFGNLPAVEDVIEVTLTSTGPSSWTARIENVGTATTLETSGGAMLPVPLSPGVWVVHADADPLFTEGEPDRGEGLEGIAEDGSAASLGTDVAERTGVNVLVSPGVYAVHSEGSILFEDGSADQGDGLERIAEDGDAAPLGAALADRDDVTAGVFDTGVGAASPGPIGPGGSFTFTVTASPSDRLSFATMYAQSNDLFFAPSDEGIELFPGGSASSGDVTDMILLWDAGTEVNEEPGIGPNQAPRQPAPDTGPAEGGVVREVDDGYDYAPVTESLRVTITPAS